MKFASVRLGHEMAALSGENPSYHAEAGGAVTRSFHVLLVVSNFRFVYSANFM